MLSEYFSDAAWEELLPGLTFAPAEAAGGAVIPAGSPSRLLEIFFCTAGSAATVRCTAVPREILMVWGSSDDIVLQAGTRGFLLSAETALLKEPFDALCRSMALDLTSRSIAALMEQGFGLRRIPETAWTRSVFTVLQCLPSREQGRYCQLRTVELLYLLATGNSLLSNAPTAGFASLARIVHAMRTYMEQHLDEKLTIAAMSTRFQISATAFKSSFRALYGQPVHTWLREKRMEHAAELLRSRPMTVLQISQEVGYESIAQFNVTFKQQFGVTPSEYRKMSISIEA